jgi:ADP-ribose pyrophosphatase
MANFTSFTQKDCTIVKRDVLCQGNFLRLARYALKHRLFNGNWSKTFDCELLERKSAAAMLPYDPALDRVLLIEQFRPGALADPKSPWLIEIPAGVIDENESPEDVAYREMIEETGAKALALHPIFEFFVSPGGANEYLHLYCCKIDAHSTQEIQGLEEENEDIRVINLSAEEAFAELYSGRIKTAPALVSLMWLQLHREQLQNMWL